MGVGECAVFEYWTHYTVVNLSSTKRKMAVFCLWDRALLMFACVSPASKTLMWVSSQHRIHIRLCFLAISTS